VRGYNQFGANGLGDQPDVRNVPFVDEALLGLGQRLHDGVLFIPRQNRSLVVDLDKQVVLVKLVILREITNLIRADDSDERLNSQRVAPKVGVGQELVYEVFEPELLSTDGPFHLFRIFN